MVASAHAEFGEVGLNTRRSCAYIHFGVNILRGVWEVQNPPAFGNSALPRRHWHLTPVIVKPALRLAPQPARLDIFGQ